MDIAIIIFQFIVLMFSAMIHEISHGSVAYILGDRTARELGRMTMDPRKHFDLWGSLVLPLLLLLASGGRIMFGWAKPVPYNPFNLKNPKRDPGLIALAGPMSNILMAVIFGLAIRLIVGFNIVSLFNLIIWFDVIVQINLILAIFNLIPIPPLDGAGILFSFLPRAAERLFNVIARYGLFILLIFLLYGFRLIYPIISWLRWLIIGSF